MAEVNDAFIAGTPPPPNNPLTTLSNAASLVGQLNQNRLFPLEQQRMELANQGQQLTNTGAGLGIQGQYQQNLDKVLGSVPQIPGEDPDAYRNRVLTAVSAGAQGGLYPADYGAAWVGGNAQGATPFADLVHQAAIRSQSPTEMEAQFGKASNVDVGGSVQGVDTNVVTGQQTPLGGGAGNLTTTLTPAQNAGRVNTTDAAGNPVSVPVSATVDATGHALPPGAPGAAAQLGPNGAMAGGPKLGAETQANTAAQGEVNQGIGIENNVVNAALASQDRRATLGTVIGLSKQLSTGPNADFWKGLGQLAAEYGITTPLTPAPGETAAREALDKLGWQVAQRQFQVLGGTGSNQQLDSAVSTSPHSSMSAEGIQNISGFLQGNEDAIQAEAKALQKWKSMPQNVGHPENNARFVNVWNGIYDPRAFQMKYEDQAGQQAILNGMKPAEQAEFQKRQKLLGDMGYLGQ